MWAGWRCCKFIFKQMVCFISELKLLMLSLLKGGHSPKLLHLQQGTFDSHLPAYILGPPGDLRVMYVSLASEGSQREFTGNENKRYPLLLILPCCLLKRNPDVWMEGGPPEAGTGRQNGLLRAGDSRPFNGSEFLQAPCEILVA